MDEVRRLVEARPDMWGLTMAQEGKRFAVNEFIDCIPSTSNVYLIHTDDGDIQVNAGLGFEAPALKAELAGLRRGRLPYLILTQGHVDHVGGVKELREPETRLIAQRNNGVCQADDRRIKRIRAMQSAAWFPAAIKQLTSPQGDKVQDVPTPDITFDDRYVFSHGGIDIELLSVPGGETVDSLAIHLPQHKIVFTGNQFGPLFPHFPNLVTIRGDRYRYAEPYLSSLRRVRDLEPDMLITGHFDPIIGKDLIRTCLDRLHDAVDFVHRKTLEGMNAGKDIFTLMREVELPEELYVGQGYGKVSYCVRTIWEQYMGWFRAEATSELFPTRPRDIYPELVEMAGAEAVIVRGREKLAAGDAESAELFAETVLTKSPSHTDALRLSLDAHRALLDRSGGTNFWETGWLRHRIGQLENALKTTNG